jgi:hypothetical protein
MNDGRLSDRNEHQERHRKRVGAGPDRDGGLDVRRQHARELPARYLEGLRAGVPTLDAAYERYRLYAVEACDATAMTIAWPGLQAPENSEAAWRRTCVAVEDLETAAALNKLG